MKLITKLEDGKVFFSTLTWRKIFNFNKLIFSFYLSKFLKKPIHWGNVASISLEPTTSCNLRCPQCPSGLRSFSRETGMLDENLAKSIIDQLKLDLINLTLYFQGEPYLNPAFLKIVKYAHLSNVYITTSTNAHYLSSSNSKLTVESGLSRLIISVDGTNQESYEKYRIGGSLEKVEEGIHNIVYWKKKLKSSTPLIVIQFIVMQHNESEIETIKEKALNWGVDSIQIKTAQIYDGETATEWLPKNSKLARYEISNIGELVIKNKLLNQCWKMWHSSVITWNGDVVPCCFDKDATHKLGSIQSNTFSNIWKDKQYQMFRQKLSKTRKEIEICKNCTEGTQVWGH